MSTLGRILLLLRSKYNSILTINPGMSTLGSYIGRFAEAPVLQGFAEQTARPSGLAKLAEGLAQGQEAGAGKVLIVFLIVFCFLGESIL
jgi:hypothetical protein